MILDLIGFNIAAFLAGLGIGGFAIAIASKDILSDIFGGLTIMLVKPFKIGDLIRIEGEESFVTSIGIRYTRLNDVLYAYEHIVPNSMITSSQMVNISSREGLVIVREIELSTNNNSQKIDLSLTLIKEVIHQNPETTFLWMKNSHFDSYAFVLTISYNVHDFAERHRVQSETNIAIIQILKEKHIAFTSMPVSLLEK